jgi:hypothetical protein
MSTVHYNPCLPQTLLSLLCLKVSIVCLQQFRLEENPLIPTLVFRHNGFVEFATEFSASRVTRLGEFFAYWATLYFGNIFEKYKCSPNFGWAYFFSTVQATY